MSDFGIPLLEKVLGKARTFDPKLVTPAYARSRIKRNLDNYIYKTVEIADKTEV